MMKQDNMIHQALENIDIPSVNPAFFANLQERLHGEPTPGVASTTTKPSRHLGRIVATSSVSVAAAAVAIALIATSNSRDGTHPSAINAPITQVPSTNTPTTEIHTLLASQVVAKMSVAIAGIHTFSATVQVVQHPYSINTAGTDSLPGHTIDGKMRLRSDGASYIAYTRGPSEGNGPQTDAYDASAGKFTSCWQSEGAWSCRTLNGVITPTFATQDNLGLQTFSSVIRNLVAVEGTPVESTEFEGRAAWKFHARLPQTDISYVDEATVYVDEETSFPLRVEFLKKGKPFSETTVRDVQVNPTLADADFRLTVPKNAQINTPEEVGYTRTTIDKLQAKIGYIPLVPATLPDGFALAEASYAIDNGPGGPEGLNEENKDVVVLTYRRGLQSVTFTTRRVGSASLWNDPFAGEFDEAITKKTVTLTNGAFAGTSVVVTTSSHDQRLWGKGSKLVLAVTGDLSADEMTAAANSLHRYGN